VILPWQPVIDTELFGHCRDFDFLKK